MTHARTNEKNPLVSLRIEIDEIDDALIGLLARRLRLSAKIGQVKHLRNLAIQDSSREKQILSRIDSRPFDDNTKHSIAAVYQEIFSQSRLVQNRDVHLAQEIKNASDVL